MVVDPNIEAVILGIVQGLTEFLPISSSGHLLIIPKVLGWPYFGKGFDAALHIGTFGALVTYFWKDLWKILNGFWVSTNTTSNISNRILLLLLAVSTFPGVLVGVMFDNLIEEKLNSVIIAVIMMVLFAILLWVSDFIGRSSKNISGITFFDALILGVSQAVALIPGVSRSGVTITAGRFLGLSRHEAAKYSFLMAIPITGGAGLYEGVKLLKHGYGDAGLSVFFIGVITSLVVGYICITFFLQYLQKHGMLPFVIYRLLAAVIVFILIGNS